VGEVGIVRRLRGQAAPHLRHQPGAHLLRADALEDAADVSLTEELLAEAGMVGGKEQEVARRLLGDLAYRSRELQEELAEVGIALVTSEASARRPRVR
jgi:hypothetical protein